MSAQFYDPNEKVASGTIVYPEIEALRYLISEQRKKIDVLFSALESISKNTCCDNCQEAKLVAKEALSQFQMNA